MSMTKIATVTVGAGGASSIDFTSIPGTMTDLMIQYSSRDSSASWNCYVTFNGSSSGYSSRILEGSGSSAASGTGGSTRITLMSVPTSQTANTFSNGTIYIPNYAGSTNKSVSHDGVTESNATLAYSQITAGLWSNTAAITSVTLSASSFVQYSTATLYGITKGSLAGVTVS